MEEERYEIRLGGSGGQGIILAAVILAEAAGLHGDNHVCQTQSYGPEARGGKSKAEVVISSREIDYPKVIRMDLFLAMNQASLDAYFYDFKPNGLLVVDATFVKQTPTSRAIAIPFTRIAREQFEQEMVANVVALGALAHLCPRVEEAHLLEAVLARVPPHTQTLNREAFAAGLAAAQKIKLENLPRSIVPDQEEQEI
ncbi:2-oxoacid:acceptor oxidoreductase family protein [Desulfurivibrio dismutans]|uniref:2-oxoacid:acceptor oxidoreductase family protein n=1 Tax=Desulfurivibrio dismutans TaxID=1398908 RepID=UPI0023DA9557|nr:2-oxoacid:acceptor oxidoreductase family protein [Desulfurivibrio alkaliphilus]MDF1614903.1 2-oxoacid:acceptor oxidoreductase family protein [Desulfurivibrio alkaliphilus]